MTQHTRPHTTTRRTTRRSRAGVLGVVTAVAAVTLAGQPAVGSQQPTVGDSQSPVDIRDEDVTYVDRLPALRVHYAAGDVTITNTGSPDHEATFTTDPAENLSITVGGERWPLAQFHWHTRSEHLRNGKSSVMEGHFVHQQADGDRLVVGVLVKAGDRHRALDPVFTDLPAPGESHVVEDVRLDRILPDDLESYRYSGSLTTAPYDEPVQWIVMDEPIELSRAQIAAFQASFPEGNTREAQPLNGRTILSDVDD